MSAKGQSQTDDSAALLALATGAAAAAGAAIMERYATAAAKVEYKADNSPLTDADRAANRIIVAALSATGLPVLSEESRQAPWEERRQWRRLWVVDPLDGTKEFIKRNGEFTVNIALVEDGRPVLGVVYAPARQVLYAGAASLGAFTARPGEHFSNPAELTAAARHPAHAWQRLPPAGRVAESANSGVRVVASRSHRNPETDAFIAGLEAEFGTATPVAIGSSLKLCLIAEAAADVYPRLAPTMEWDTAAGQAVVEAAGGRVLRAADRQPLAYNKEDLLNPSFIACRVGWRFAWAGAEF